jgi:hypothetical protein
MTETGEIADSGNRPSAPPLIAVAGAADDRNAHRAFVQTLGSVAAIRARHQCAIASAAPVGSTEAVRSHRCREPRTALYSNAVDVLDPLVDQAVTLTMQSTIIFFGDTWHPHHAPHLRLAAQIRHQ